MLRIPCRRLHRRFIRITFIVLLIFGIIDLLSLSWTSSRQRPYAGNRHKTPREKIFIASTHWNSGYVLKNHWNNAVVDLAKHFGPENIYISIYESGSWDNSKGALRELDRQLEDLEVQRTMVLDETSHAHEIAKPPASTGWIDTPRGKKEIRRISYLAKLRNLSLKPLADLALNGITFDKVLFLNDVIFKTEDIVNLLDTRDGDYAAACSLDFSKPPAYYDTFALRDSEGHEAVTPIFPYFRSRASRKAIMAHEPVPVQSCWNGMVVFDAAPFYGNSDALRFRGIPDSLAGYHLEASECCLIHADNPLTASRGVWLNSNVRVGYNLTAYDAVHRGPSWPSLGETIRGVWTNRLRRWLTVTFPQTWRISGRVRAWEAASIDHYEPGVHCLINEMQVLVWNGWAHV